MSQQHWDRIYMEKDETDLGWYQDLPQPDLDLILAQRPKSENRILLVGSGVSNLVEELLERNYQNLIVTDISMSALKILQEKLPHDDFEIIRDDLCNPVRLPTLDPVDLWHDRATLHFLTGNEERSTYSNLIQKLVRTGGIVVLGQFSKKGADRCSGLDVYQYDLEEYQKLLGPKFDLLDTMDFTYTMPSGDPRPYIYATFKKIE